MIENIRDENDIKLPMIVARESSDPPDIHFSRVEVGYAGLVRSHLMRAAVFAALGLLASANSAGGVTLELKGRIPLPDYMGRIDHLAFDPVRNRLYVAELGNDSVAVVDVNGSRLERRLDGLDEPQGIAYFAPLQRLYVAAGGDGTVRAYDGHNLTLVGNIKLSNDADNIRIDPEARRVYVGYGAGALAVLDPVSLERVGEIPLKGHPESFQLSPVDGHV